MAEECTGCYGTERDIQIKWEVSENYRPKGVGTGFQAEDRS